MIVNDQPIGRWASANIDEQCMKCQNNHKSGSNDMRTHPQSTGVPRGPIPWWYHIYDYAHRGLKKHTGHWPGPFKINLQSWIAITDRLTSTHHSSVITSVGTFCGLTSNAHRPALRPSQKRQSPALGNINNVVISLNVRSSPFHRVFFVVFLLFLIIVQSTGVLQKHKQYCCGH